MLVFYSLNLLSEIYRGRTKRGVALNEESALNEVVRYIHSKEIVL